MVKHLWRNWIRKNTSFKNIRKENKKTKIINAENSDNKTIEYLSNLDCLIIENFKNNIDEDLLYSILNQSKLLDNFLLINSRISIKDYDLNLLDLKSRLNSFIFIGIDLPNDDLLRVVITKSLSDKQISISPKLSDYIINNVERSYEKMFKFIKDLDELFLSTGKSININLIKSIKQMNKYRTHNCSELDEKAIDKTVHLSGWYIEKEIMVIYYY